MIGVPKAFANVELLKSHEFYGQFGRPEKIVINHNPKKEINDSFSRVYESQVAIYIHYQSKVDVAVAIKVRIGVTNWILVLERASRRWQQQLCTEVLLWYI